MIYCDITLTLTLTHTGPVWMIFGGNCRMRLCRALPGVLLRKYREPKNTSKKESYHRVISGAPKTIAKRFGLRNQTAGPKRHVLLFAHLLANGEKRTQINHLSSIVFSWVNIFFQSVPCPVSLILNYNSHGSVFSRPKSTRIM